MAENEALKSALEKVRAQKINFGFLERFDVDENWEVMKALEEIQEYRAIGTVEECRVAVEKQKPMKIKEIHCDEYYCPACYSENNCNDGRVEDKFCRNCGQALNCGEEGEEG